ESERCAGLAPPDLGSLVSFMPWVSLCAAGVPDDGARVAASAPPAAAASIASIPTTIMVFTSTLPRPAGSLSNGRAHRLERRDPACRHALARLIVHPIVAVGAGPPRMVSRHAVPLQGAPQLGLPMDRERALERRHHLGRLVALEQEPGARAAQHIELLDRVREPADRAHHRHRAVAQA